MTGLLSGHLETVRLALRSGRLGPRRALSQNFLLQAAMLRKIAARLGDLQGRCVVEIGPGPGGLTAALLEAGARVVAFEVDDDWATFLREQLAGQPLHICSLDVRAHRGREFAGVLAALARARSEPLLLASNLPYHIASPILVDLVRAPIVPERSVVMVQREVAERLLAAPGASQRGLLTVLVTMAATVKRCFHVPPGAFRPPPRVHSTVLEILPDPSGQAQLGSGPFVEKLLKMAFQGRRKMLRRSLAEGLNPAALDGVSPALLRRRPQDLSNAEWLDLADRIRPREPL